jgi:cytochrome c-type biogenesis protein CcmH/NrfG
LRGRAETLQNTHALFGMAQAEAAAGDSAAARETYTKFLALMAKGDGTRPELEIARRSVASR